MKTSCNGCRILRKGCSDDCTLRPCLDWIKTPESQANATLFLAKFYGRTGLLNLVNAGPNHLRPAIFRSLLYEACGRIVNPVYGSVGLLWSNNWDTCQSAVDAVLSGSPIVKSSPHNSAEAGMHPIMPLDSSVYSIETVEASLTNRARSGRIVKPGPESSKETEIGLELSLGLQSSVAGLRG